MSIVERAISKIQQSRQPAERVVPVPAATAAAAPAAPAAPVVEHAPSAQLAARRSISINRDQLVQQGLLPSRVQAALIEEQFRSIKRPLLANAFGKNAPGPIAGTLLMVGSAVPGEGKTFTTFNLALSMAQERDHPVLLIDADVCKPDISAKLGLAEEIGLLDLLEDERLDLADVLLATDYDRLFFMPCGKPRPNAAELLSSRRMEELMRLLTGVYRDSMILLDSPPLLLTNESRVIAGLAGQVALVVAANKTPQADVMQAITLIEEEKPLNLVLNRSDVASSNYRYGYGYGHNYDAADAT